MHRKDNNPRPPSALEEPANEEVTSPSAQVYDDGAKTPAASQEKVTAEYPPDDDPSVEISMSSVPEDIAVIPTPQPRRETPRVPPPPPVSLSDPRIGETLVGRYRLDKLIGKGGMGRVYRATQFPLNRPVAVKILNPEFQKKDPQFVRRFFLEAASAARLTHPNTITVFDYGEAESGELFIAMEYLAGRPLSRVIAAEGPFEAERALHVGMQICRALREAHTKGIIHRDLKPGNILLLEEGDDADFVKVLDFGLVKVFHTESTRTASTSGMLEPLTPEPPEGELTKAGMFLGSPKYMSPEQIQGVALDPRTDVYSLGVLMYQMISGHPPFKGATSVEVIYKHVNEVVPKFSSYGVNVPLELEELVLGALAKRRDERYESMSAFLVRMKDVRRLLTGISASLETGIDIHLSDVRRNTPSVMPAAATGSHTGSIRPQTRPHMPTQEPSEVAFSEHNLDRDTGSLASALGRSSPRSSRLAMVAPVAAACALVVVLGLLTFVIFGNRRPTVAPPPVTTEDPILPRGPMSHVRFTSTPPGAEVFEHGVSLGRTPLLLNFPQDVEGADPHTFLFKLKGVGEVEELVRFDKKEIAVSVRLGTGQATPPPPPPRNGANGEDYKENPY